MSDSLSPGFLSPGTMVAGRYEIREMIGRGGMGQVFLAYDQKTDQEVALKTLLRKYGGNEQAVARFVREVKTCRQLDHPGVVKVYDAQEWNNILFYTMEYLPGKTLRCWLQERARLDFGSGVRVLCLVADALEHAHAITIHRDLSPENVMVLADGSVRLLDFGLAKLDDKFKGLTMAGANLGKLMYIAPEQEIDAATVDYRADLYSLGIMFFEVMVGRTPLPGEKLADLRPDLPPEADGFFRKAIAYRPTDRFQSAYEFRDALLGLYRMHEARGMVTKTAPSAKGIRTPPGVRPSRSGGITKISSFFCSLFRRN